ncbi:hypothetical protein M422DRAFT_154278 [Sphaerobolus stellatus SS14]|nr:hypothetical protein M422DRAFT_154278 [Sphaerobolus stellatus SS14]
MRETKHRRRPRHLLPFITLALTSLALVSISFPAYWSTIARAQKLPINANIILDKCAVLALKPRVPEHFAQREESDRYVPGTPPVLIHNATIWTGDDNGKEIAKGDLLIARGIIKWIGGKFVEEAKEMYGQALEVVDAKGAWVTPGIVDLHSHLGVDSSPALQGSSDTNSIHGITQPWLRSLDGLNTHDDAYALSISGGLTTSNVLPGSANAIGGQAFPIKLRPTGERSASSKLVEQFGSPNSTGWRQMKHACGENPSGVYDGTRMDTIWAFRAAYNEARKLVEAQDTFCATANSGKWSALNGKDFPEDLKWEALADVIRGKVKVHNHCYEAVDFDGIVRLTNEFKFPIAAFHHASEAYLVPDLIKKAWGETPAIAIFATNARYKREAFRGSEFAASILADNGLRVVMKSDHPVLDSRHLLWEAQQAYYYGLPANLALTSVTSTPATVMGLGHRIGHLKPGYDADLVIWDSHPLFIGATPKQVYIDGIAQLSNPHIIDKPAAFQELPKVPNFDKEKEAAVKWEGLPPLVSDGSDIETYQNVVFESVGNVWSAGEVKTLGGEKDDVVVVENGKIACIGTYGTCSVDSALKSSYAMVNLKNGSLAPGLTSFGSPLGLVEIDQEPSTRDGRVFDALRGESKAVAGGDGGVVAALDGLQFTTRDALLAYRSGVTSAITPPDGRGSFRGLGVFFGTGRLHALEKGAVISPVTGLHYAIHHSGSPSVSTQIGTLRKLLLGEAKGDLKHAVNAVLKGSIPLIIHTSSADIIATLITLKREVESFLDTSIRLTIVGAAESHLLAKELAEANVGIVLVPVRQFPFNWEGKRIVPGPPTTADNAVGTLIKAGVTVAIGVIEAWEARNARFDAAWAALEISSFTKSEALALVSTNVRKLLGGEVDSADEDIVAYMGGDVFDMQAKVVGVVSQKRGEVELW